MLIDIIKPDYIHEDDRGRLIQLVHEGYSQFNIISSKKSSLRGGHFHKENSEAFWVISGRFRLDAEKDGMKESYDLKEGDMFVIPPYVIHSFYYEEDTLLASMYSKGVENNDGTKDIFKKEEI